MRRILDRHTNLVVVLATQLVFVGAALAAVGLLLLTSCQAPTQGSASARPRLGDTRIDENGQAWRLIGDMGRDDLYPERWVRIESIDLQ